MALHRKLNEWRREKKCMGDTSFLHSLLIFFLTRSDDQRGMAWRQATLNLIDFVTKTTSFEFEIQCSDSIFGDVIVIICVCCAVLRLRCMGVVFVV